MATTLVIGATGILGREVVGRLRAEGRSVRALVRAHSDPEKVQALRDVGADIVEGDLKDPDTLPAACAGVTHVVSTASSTLSRGEGDTIDSVDRQGQLNLIEAARKAGVQQFVLVSFPAASMPFPLQDAKRVAEDALRASGMSYTILQPTHFWEILVLAGPGVRSAGPHRANLRRGHGADAVGVVLRRGGRGRPLSRQPGGDQSHSHRRRPGGADAARSRPGLRRGGWPAVRARARAARRPQIPVRKRCRPAAAVVHRTDAVGRVGRVGLRQRRRAGRARAHPDASRGVRPARLRRVGLSLRRPGAQSHREVVAQHRLDERRAVRVAGHVRVQVEPCRHGLASLLFEEPAQQL